MCEDWTFRVDSFNVSNRLALVKEGRGTALGADTDGPFATDGRALVSVRRGVTAEAGAADSTMVEEL